MRTPREVVGELVAIHGDETALDGAPRRKREGGTFTVTGLDKTQRELLARVVAAMSSTAWREPWASYTVSMIEAAAEAELRARPLQARKNG